MTCHLNYSVSKEEMKRKTYILEILNQLVLHLTGITTAFPELQGAQTALISINVDMNMDIQPLRTLINQPTKIKH